MSWLFSQALVAEYSRATCWDGAPSAPLSVMPTQHKFWRNDKTLEPCDLSRFGLTCAALTEDRGADLLTWFLADSRARTSAWPAREPALKASAAACGPTWRGSLARFDPALRSWRTAQQSLLGDSDECSVTWPRSGMTAGGQCWELPTLAPPTSATGSGLWPTPTVCGNYNRKGASATSGDGLATAVMKWPTPMAADSRGSSGKPAPGKQIQLVDAVRRVATPTARDWKSGKASEATMERNSRPLSEQIGGLLNPTWVEWLMGWPIGWTDLRPSATAKCPDALQPRGECSLVG
jgi:hypothetical protein